MQLQHHSLKDQHDDFQFLEDLISNLITWQILYLITLHTQNYAILKFDERNMGNLRTKA